MSEEKSPMPYIVVEEDRVAAIQRAVEAMIDQGYVPLGGVQVVRAQPVGSLEPIFTFYQTMVFNEV